MLHTFHVVGSRSIGGAENFLLRLVQGLSHQGIGATVVARSSSGITQRLGRDIPSIHLPMANMWDGYSRWKIKSLVSRHKPQIVQTYMSRATWLTNIKKGRGTVHVARLGGFYDLKRFHHAHFWIGNTTSICDYLLQHGFPADRVVHIPNFVEPVQPYSMENTKAFKRGMSIPDDAWILFAAGRFVTKKGFQDLIHAFSHAPKSISDRPVYLVMAGGGDKRGDLEKLANQLGVSTRVKWTGWLPDLDPCYAMADVFVCPSRHEPFGNVILEAWSHSTPVLVTATHAACEFVNHESNGIVVPVQKPKVMADELSNLLKQYDAVSEQLISGGHGTLKARFSKQSVLDAYETLYSKLAEPNTG